MAERRDLTRRSGWRRKEETMARITKIMVMIMVTRMSFWAKVRGWDGKRRAFLVCRLALYVACRLEVGRCLDFEA